MNEAPLIVRLRCRLSEVVMAASGGQGGEGGLAIESLLAEPATHDGAGPAVTAPTVNEDAAAQQALGDGIENAAHKVRRRHSHVGDGQTVSRDGERAGGCKPLERGEVVREQVTAATALAQRLKADERANIEVEEAAEALGHPLGLRGTGELAAEEARWIVGAGGDPEAGRPGMLGSGGSGRDWDHAPTCAACAVSVKASQIARRSWMPVDGPPSASRWYHP